MRCLFACACIGELRSLIAWTWGPACASGQKALFKPDFHDVQQCHKCRADSEIVSNKSVETTIRKQRIMLCSHGAWRIFDRLKTRSAFKCFFHTELTIWTARKFRRLAGQSSRVNEVSRQKISPMPCERSLRLVRKVLISYPDLTLSKGDMGTRLGKSILNGRIVKTKPSRNRLQYYFKSLRSLPSFPSLDFFPAIVAIIWTPGLVMN